MWERTWKPGSLSNMQTPKLTQAAWHCSGPKDGCYIDQESACGEQNAVTCTNTLGGAATQACCPRLTTCVPGYTFTDQFVRCQILYSDLQRAGTGTLDSSNTSPAALSSTTSSSPATSSPTTTPLPTSSQSTPTGQPSSNSIPQSATADSTAAPQSSQQTQASQSPGGLSTGAVAGISVATTLALVTAIVFMVLWLRGRRRASASAGQPTEQTVASYVDEEYKAHNDHSSMQVQELSWEPAARPPVEMLASTVPNRAPVEI